MCLLRVDGVWNVPKALFLLEGFITFYHTSYYLFPTFQRILHMNVSYDVYMSTICQHVLTCFPCLSMFKQYLICDAWALHSLVCPPPRGCENCFAARSPSLGAARTGRLPGRLWAIDNTIVGWWYLVIIEDSDGFWGILLVVQRIHHWHAIVLLGIFIGWWSWLVLPPGLI